MCCSRQRVAIASLMILSCVQCSVHAAEPTVEKIVDNGKVVKLKSDAMLGTEQSVAGCFALRSATPGTVDEFGSHYLSIAMLADVILAPGDFQISLKMGLVKLSEQPGPVILNVKIDLYNAVLPDHAKYWTAPNNIHFNEAGSAFMGRQVANAILPLLGAGESQ